MCDDFFSRLDSDCENTDSISITWDLLLLQGFFHLFKTVHVFLQFFLMDNGYTTPGLQYKPF